MSSRGLIAEQGLAGRRGIGANAAAIHVRHDIGGVLGQQLVTRLARLERLVGELQALGHLIECICQLAELRRLPGLERRARVEVAFAHALGSFGKLSGGAHLAEGSREARRCRWQWVTAAEAKPEAAKRLSSYVGKDVVARRADDNAWRRMSRHREVVRSRKPRWHH